jgi:hypothetical protein
MSYAFTNKTSAGTELNIFKISAIVLTILNGAVCLAEDNLALGRPYTFSHPPNYPETTEAGDATDLTDGFRYTAGGALWSVQTTVGWAAGDQVKHIEIDLGQICSINRLTFSTGANAVTGVSLPLAVMVFLSDDGLTYSYAGDLINEAFDQDQYILHTFELAGLTDQARFVRLETISGSFFLFADEIEVFGTAPGGLTPQNRALQANSVTQFARDRIPLARQKNSSLTLLGLAQARLAGEPAQYLAAVAQAQAALDGILPQILARSTAETVDFRSGVPFTQLDHTIFMEIGTYLTATGRSGLHVNPADLWTPLSPFDWDATATSSAPPLLMQDEWGELAFNLVNATAAPVALSVTVSNLQVGAIPVSTDAISLYEIIFVEAFGFRLRADALMPLTGTLDIPAGMTKQLWLTIDARGLGPGTYHGSIEISGGGFNVTEPFAFTVTPMAMPEKPTLNVLTYSYMHWPLPTSHPQSVADDLSEHYVNAQQVISFYLPNFSADAEGNFTAPMNFSALDAYMDLLPDTSLWILWTQFEEDHRGMYPIPGDAVRANLFTQWVEAVIAHMLQKGYGYDEFAFSWIDEASQQQMLDIVKPSSELLRQIDPNAQVWMNISSDNTEASLAVVEGLIDIWCPTSSKLGWDFWQDKRTWFYDSASDKGRSPTGHYRYKLWTAFNEDCEGNGFWTYTDNRDLWNDYAGTPTYSVVYDGPNGVVSSKRWEAYRAGVEDYELCRMLSDAVAAAEAAGRGDTAVVNAARTGLAGWVNQVLANPNDPTVAEQAHRELLTHLANVAASAANLFSVAVDDVLGTTFNSVLHAAYRLQSTPDLVSSNFSDTGGIAIGNGGVMTLFDPTGPSTSKNYRVLQN